MKITKIIKPSFEKVDRNFVYDDFWNRVKQLWKEPPRIRLKSDMVIYYDNGICVIIPSGFTIDGASVPRILWFIPGFSPFGPLFYGAIPHDFAYQYGYLLARKDSYIPKAATLGTNLVADV